MSTRDPDKVFDELLVMQYLSGDKKAFNLLVQRWNKRIVMYAFRNTQNMEAAKDIAQEVWIIALRSLKKLQNQSRIGSWLLSITHHKSVDWIRSNQKPQTNNSELQEDSNVAISGEDQLKIMRKAMYDLNEDHRNILSLFYLEGFSVIEIAQIMQLSKGTVKSRLFYARESLKKKIKNYNHE